MRATGLLGPRGEHVPCAFYQHSETAKRVHLTRYQDQHDACEAEDGMCLCELRLDQLGWVRIGSDGAVTDSGWYQVNRVTQAQLDVLWDLATTPGESGESASNLMREVARLAGE